jgi:tape measure domain-containing protein
MPQNQTLFDDLADVRGILKGIDQLSTANEKYGKTAEQINERIRASQKQVIEDLKLHKTVITELNVVQKARQTQLQQEAAEAAKVVRVAKEQNELLERNKQAFDANGAAVTSLKSRIADLRKEYDSLSNAESKELARKQAIEAETKALNTVLNAQVAATKRATAAIAGAVGSYDRLNAELNEMKTRLREMPNAFNASTGALNKNNKAAMDLQRQIQKTDGAIKAMDSQMGNSQRNVGNYGSAFGGLSGGIGGMIGKLGIAALVVQQLIAPLGELIDTASRYERLDAALKAVSVDNADFNKTQSMLLDTSDRLGISYEVLAGSYKSLKAASRGTSIEGEQTEKIFLSIVRASAALKLTSDQTEGALNAVQQMMSKGKVQAEELRNQLGERLPGAFKIFAQAMGVSEIKLNKMLEDGEVLASDVLPKVAEQLEKTYGSKAASNINTIAGSTERLSTQTDLLVNVLANDSGVTNFWAKFKNGLADTFKLVRETYQSKEWTQLFGVLSNDGAISQRAKFGSKTRSDFGAMTPAQRKSQLEYLSDLGDGLIDPRAADKGKITQAEAQRLYRELWAKNVNMLAEEKQKEIAARKNIDTNANQQLELFANQSRVKQEKALKEQAKKSGAAEKQKYADMLAVYKEQNSEYLAKRAAIDAKNAKTPVDVLKERISAIKELLETQTLADLKAGRVVSVDPAKVAELTKLQKQLETVDETMKSIEQGFFGAKKVIDYGNIDTIAQKSSIDTTSLETGQYDKKGKPKTGVQIDAEEAKRTARFEKELQKQLEMFQHFAYEKLSLEHLLSTDLVGAKESEKKQLLQLLQDIQDAEKAGNKERAADLKTTLTGMVGDIKQTQQALREIYIEIGASIVNGMIDINRQQTSNRMTELEKQKENELAMADESASGREAIERKYDVARKQLLRQQAIQDKLQAMFNVAVNTIVNVSKAANPAMKVALGIAGAVQLGLLAAKPLPAYKDGKNLETLDRYEGPALAGEAGRELWFHDGKADLLSKPSVINVGRNDVIAPNSLTEKLLSDQNAFASSNMLQQIAIGQATSDQMTRRQNTRSGNGNSNLSAIAIGKAVAQELKKLPFDKVDIDERGFTRAIIDGTTKRILRNNKRRLGDRM